MPDNGAAPPASCAAVGVPDPAGACRRSHHAAPPSALKHASKAADSPENELFAGGELEYSPTLYHEAHRATRLRRVLREASGHWLGAQSVEMGATRPLYVVVYQHSGVPPGFAQNPLHGGVALPCTMPLEPMCSAACRSPYRGNNQWLPLASTSSQAVNGVSSTVSSPVSLSPGKLPSVAGGGRFAAAAASGIAKCTRAGGMPSTVASSDISVSLVH